MQWEYKIELPPSIAESLQILDSLGDDGWELVSLQEGVFVFKRPNPPPEVTQQEAPQDTQQVEYITPTAAHVGQMVEVFKRGRWTKNLELLAVMPDSIRNRFVVRCQEDPGEWTCWKQARVAVK